MQPAIGTMHVSATIVPFDTMRQSAHWRSWGALAGTAPPFLAPEFFALMTPLVPRGTPLVAEAWSSTCDVVGSLPIVLDGTTLRALRTDHSPGYDFCGTTDAIDAIWHCLREDDRWSELVLDRVPDDSLLATRLPALAREAGCPVVIRPDTHHPYFTLAGFEAAIPAKFRVNLLRCARKAGGVELERIACPTRADLDAATAIEAMAWKGAAGTAIAVDPKVEHVYHALARVFGRRGRSALYFLRAGGQRIATLFAVEDDHTLYALKIGFDPRHAAVSPGHLMILEVARDAERRGLAELDFVGRQDDWKRKWTHRTYGQVAVTIYQRSARGLVRYGLRELVKPRLPEPIRSTPRSPLPRRCQRADVMGDHTRYARVLGRIDRGLGVKAGLRRLIARAPARAPLGEPSKFPVGSWVRVLDRPQLKATLDDRQRTRGLALVPTQLASCGQIYKVARHVRRIRDDHGQFRPVARTVLLDGCDCSGHGAEPTGCGRHCPMMFRDEWLEPASPPRMPPPTANTQRHARVRDVDEIAAGLDLFGRRDGVTFMAEMVAYAGRRFPIARELTAVFEYGKWTRTPRPMFILDGPRCTGAGTGSRGPCDRACALVWHPDWLVVEDA